MAELAREPQTPARLLMLWLGDGLALFDRRTGDSHVLDADNAAALMKAAASPTAWKTTTAELGLADLGDAWTPELAAQSSLPRTAST